MTVKLLSPLTIIYFSQTGQAQAIAESIFDLTAQNNFDAKLYNIKDYDQTCNLSEETSPIVIVCSTTGEGDLPEAAFKFWNKLKRLNEASGYLKKIKYALLGLGDTNYSIFCGGPKKLHKKFQELGAKCFYGPFWADDGTSLELEVEPFKDGLWKALNILDSENPEIQSIEKSLTVLSLADVELTIPVLAERILRCELDEPPTEILTKSDRIELLKSVHSSNDIYTATLSSNKIITSKFAVKTCHNLQFIGPHHFDYEPGDSINIICPNDKDEIVELLKRLNINESATKIIRITSDNPKKVTGKKFVELTASRQVSLLDFFTYCVDIRASSLKKALVRMLASCCTDKSDEIRLLELCSKEGSEQFQTMLKDSHISLLDLLNIFKSCQPELGFLIQNLSPLLPRAYSLCSFYDPNQSTNTLEIIFNLVNFEMSHYRTYSRKGIATGYLSSLKEDENIFFLKRKFQSFTFPKDEDLITKPFIMVGPGTGVAPFMSYLRYKLSQKDLARNLSLFFGCRDPQKDFFFKSEIVNFSNINLLKKFCVSFSRVESIEDTDDKEILKNIYTNKCKYVQDAMKLNAKELCEAIYRQNGYVYICGDGANMCKDVQKCLAECLAEEYKISLEDSNKYVLEMMKEKRLRQDIWV